MDWWAKNLSRFHVLILISVKVLRVLFPKYKSNIHGKGLKIKSLSSWIWGCHPDLQTPWSWWFNDISKFAGALEFFTLIIINNIAGLEIKDFSVKNQLSSPILFCWIRGKHPQFSRHISPWHPRSSLSIMQWFVTRHHYSVFRTAII